MNFKGATKWLLLVLCVGLVYGVSYRLTGYRGYFNYRAPLWADAAGYYAYLPATFLYGFQGSQELDSFSKVTGEGFFFEHGKLYTKYTYGAALLQLPFFLGAHIYSKITAAPADGFSPPYQEGVRMAAAFYAVLGLWLLYLFLRRYFSRIAAAAASVSIFMGSNAWYYATDSVGMSHIYSFFLIALFLYSTKKILDAQEYSWRCLLLFSFSFALIVLVRPINTLVVLVPLLLDVQSFSHFKERLQSWLRPKVLLTGTAALVLVLLPQMIYFHWLSGKWGFWSYGNEHFARLGNPFLAQVVFSPFNGLLPYSPILWLALPLTLWLIWKLHTNGWLIFGMLCIVAYLTASWSNPAFGCSYGSRNFVEYMPLVAWALAWGIERLWTERLGIAVLLILLAGVNLKLSANQDKCFLGRHAWDWEEYVYLLRHQRTFLSNDFEDNSGSPEVKETGTAHSGRHAALLSAANPFVAGYTFEPKQLSPKPFRRIYYSVWVKAANLPVKAEMVASLYQRDSTVHWSAANITRDLKAPDEWVQAKGVLALPLRSGHNTFKLFVMHSGGEVWVDDVRLWLE